MATWIERYKAGECAAVWAELESAAGPAGAKIRAADRKAAQLVARETMERSRSNVLALFDALLEIGYRFQGAPEPGEPDYPLELRIQGALEYVRVHGGRKYKADPWPHPAFAWLEDEEIEIPAHHRNGRPGRANYRRPGSRTAAALAAVEARIGAELPMAVRCWFETVGSVDLGGTHPMLNRAGEGNPLRVVLEGADALAGGGAGTEFVASMRHAFAWGGFPGWAGKADAPEPELAWLRARLVAI
jgi:hypothetical protein